LQQRHATSRNFSDRHLHKSLKITELIYYNRYFQQKKYARPELRREYFPEINGMLVRKDPTSGPIVPTDDERPLFAVCD
jgi:hypothetical protein